ncbi:ParA family protein [Xanthomonas theicola]|nr:ParA family protein [Xanthomonas theicola]QNH27210.1 ParA family protein [Xanthomonas theicola]
MTQIIACANLKGGEGKTTLSRHLAHYAQKAGYKTLAVDLDPQTNLTYSLRPRGDNTAATSSASLFVDDFSPEKIVLVQTSDGIDLLPADERLDVLAEIEGARSALVKRASTALRAVAARYDVVVVDTPTNAPVCYLAGLAAADGSVSPVQMDTYGLNGAVRFLKEVQRVRSHYNPKLKHLGFVVNRFNSRAKSHQELLEAARGKGLPLLGTVLRERVAVQDSLARGMPVWRGPRGTVNRLASTEFRSVCAEILAGVGMRAKA